MQIQIMHFENVLKDIINNVILFIFHHLLLSMFRGRERGRGGERERERESSFKVSCFTNPDKQLVELDHIWATFFIGQFKYRTKNENNFSCKKINSPYSRYTTFIHAKIRW